MKTSRILSLLTVVTAAFTIAACAPSAKQLKEAVEKDPSIVFAAIEKDPAKFIEIVNKAAQDAQKVGAEKAQDDKKNLGKLNLQIH